MTKLDQFESVFKSADKAVYTYDRPTFDRVLLDAPCSGTGVFSRHAEARWRKKPEDLSRHAERQFSILEAAFERLRPGGTLVYSTC